MNQKNNQLKKEIQLKCSVCQTIYQLLETQCGNNSKCSDNCLVKWQETLAEYHHKEMLSFLDEKESSSEEEETNHHHEKQ